MVDVARQGRKGTLPPEAMAVTDPGKAFADVCKLARLGAEPF